MAEKYASVNGEWPSVVPPITGPEAITAVKRLWRLTMKRPWRKKIKLTSGNRRGVRILGGVLRINPSAGWHDIVHSLSHRCHYQLHPTHKAHDGRGTHAFIERQMIAHVVKSGWLDGKLKRPERQKPTVDSASVKFARITSRIAIWESKRKRAERALRKLRLSQRYYERKLAA